MNIKDDLEKTILREVKEHKKLCCMLSGGIDSFLITYLASNHTNCHAITVSSNIKDGDAPYAIKCAKLLNIPLDILLLTPEDAFNSSFEMLKRFELSTIVRLQCGIVAVKCIEWTKNNNFTAILCGDGADALFGSTGPMRAKSKMSDFVSYKRQVFLKSLNNGVGKDFIDICKEYQIKPILPYRDMEIFERYSVLDDDVVNKPVVKTILRSCLDSIFPREIVYRERLTLQDGVGFKKQHIKLLQQWSRKGYSSPQYIIREILRDEYQLSLLSQN